MPVDRDQPATPSEQLLFARAELLQAQQQRDARRAARAAAHARLVGADPLPSASSAPASAPPRTHRRTNSSDAARTFFSASTTTSSLSSSSVGSSSSTSAAPWTSARPRVVSDLSGPAVGRRTEWNRDTDARRASAPMGKSHGHRHRRSRTASIAHLAALSGLADPNPPRYSAGQPYPAPPAPARGTSQPPPPRPRTRTTSLPTYSARGQKRRDPCARQEQAAPHTRPCERTPQSGERLTLSLGAPAGPIRPFFQFWLAASLSSLALVALGVLMSISYVLTAYDDAARRSRLVSSASGRIRSALHTSLSWVRGKVVPAPAAAAAAAAASAAATAGAAQAQAQGKDRGEKKERPLLSQLGLALAMALGAGIMSLLTPSPPPAASATPYFARPSESPRPRERFSSLSSWDP